MKPDVSFLQYMKAHGNTPGPTQRPLLNGAICGFAAGIPSAAVLYFSGALASVSGIVGFNDWFLLIVHLIFMTLAGMLYAQIFKLAANDRKGGWLFGACFGFLLWVVGPISIWQIVSVSSVATGVAAKGIFGAYILFGLLLGILFPQIHSLIQHKVSDGLTKTANGPALGKK